MKRVFDILEPFQVPDGTLVSPFFNPKDSQSGLPFDLLDSFSIAGGRIESSKLLAERVLPPNADLSFHDTSV